MELSDADLMEHWQRGDTAAFAVLADRWQHPVGRFLRNMVGCGELAQDLCQEVFLRMYHARCQYREEGSFSTWLYRIAMNVARDAGRRRRREPGPLGNGELVDKVSSPERVCQERESALIVSKAVAELPEQLRLVLVLRHYEGMKFEQMARLTGTPASTLKSRFGVALTRLRIRLGQLGLHPEEISS